VAASVAVYVTDYCPYCTRAKALLSKKGAQFDEIDVSERPELRSWLMATSRQRTVPQVFINGRPHGGFTDIAELDRRGKLDALLAADPSVDDPVIQR
jgi:glutaredoxin 3